MSSQLEELLAFQFRSIGETPEREHRFHDTRKWRFDFAWPAQKIAVEVEGGVFIQGRHSRGASMLADMEKYNAASEAGWKLFRYGKPHIRSGEAAMQVQRALRSARGNA